MFKKGDVVRIKDSVAKAAVNHETIADHGYLWVVLDFTHQEMTMAVQSVASGKVLSYARMVCFEKPGVGGDPDAQEG